MFTLHIDTIGHYQCKPQPGWDVLHSSFWSIEACRVPVLCVLGTTPAGQKTCVHIHGQFPYLLVPLSRAKADDNYLHRFAARLEDAIRSAIGRSTTNTHHVFSISLISGRLKTENKEIQVFMKVCFYDPDIVLKAAHLLQDGAVLNTRFQPWGADIPFFLQFIIDRHVHDVSHLHLSAFKLRLLRKTPEGGGDQGCRLTEGDVCHPASDLASVQWISFGDVLSATSLSQCQTCHTCSTTTPPALHWAVDNMPSEMLSSVCLEPQSLCEVEVDVRAADIIPSGHGCETTELSMLNSLAGLVEKNSSIGLFWCAAHGRSHQDLPTVNVTDSTHSENEHYIIDGGIRPFKVDSDDDCAMDDSDWDDEEDIEEEEDDDDSDGDIPQLDGTSDDTTASKKSKKRATGKNSKLGTSSGGSGREDSSSQGEGSNPSCSPQVQSPVMVAGGDTPLPREQGVMSPYRHQQGGFPYQGGYYRQQWGESAMASSMASMTPYPGYHPASGGWGQSAAAHSAYPFMHRFQGYYPYPRHHPYSPAFRQNGTLSSRQQSNFSPPVGSPMSPPSFPSSGPAVHPQSTSTSQQYAHFMSPQAAAMRRHSDGSVAPQDRQFSGSAEWQYPGPVLNNWGFAQGMPSGPVQGMPSGPVQGMPSGPVQSMPPAPAHSRSSGTVTSISAGTIQGMPLGPVHRMSPVSTVTSGPAMPSGPVQSMSPLSTMSSGSGPSGPAQSMSPVSTMPSGSVQSMSLESALLSGPAQNMSTGSVMPSASVHSVSSESAVSSGSVQSRSSGSTTAAEGVSAGLVERRRSGPAENKPSEPAQSGPSGPLRNAPSHFAQSVQARSEDSISAGSAQSVPPKSVQSNLNEAVPHVQTGPDLSMPPVSAQGTAQRSTLTLTRTMPFVQGTPSRSVPDTTPGSNSGMLSEPVEGMSSGSAPMLSSGMSQDTPAGSAQCTPAVSVSSQSAGSSVSTSSGLPAAASQAMEFNVISSGLSAPGSSQNVASCDTLVVSPSITPVSSQYVLTSATTSGSLSSDSPIEASMKSCVSVPAASGQNSVTGSGGDKPADSPHVAPSQSSSGVSLGSQVTPSGSTHSGSCPSVSSKPSYAAPAGSFRDMSSNWWSSSFPGAPRPMQNSTPSPVGHSQFSPMHSDAMAGQRHPGFAQTHFQNAGGLCQSGVIAGNHPPPGQTQPGPMPSFQKPMGRSQQCGVQNIPDPPAHSQPFPVQHGSQNLTGPRYPGPAQNIHSPVGQRYPGPAPHAHGPYGLRPPVPAQNLHIPSGQRQPGPLQDSSHSQMEQGQGSAHSFPSDQHRRLSQISTGPDQSSQSQMNTLPCERNQWQDSGNPPSTLQGLLSAPDSSRELSSHGPSGRRAMSMDCSPSDFYASPTRGPEGNEAVRREFKQPQKRSGSFSSPFGFSAGSGASSALSSLYNFVSNVDPMARTPTPTSRNSTPSSTPHSDPSPNPSHRQDEEMGPMEVKLGPAKWQPHLPSPQASLPRSSSVDEALGSSAKQLTPAASPLMGSSSVGSNKSSITEEQVMDSEVQSKQPTDLSEAREKPSKKEKAADAQVVMCSKEVSCDSLDVSVLLTDCKSTKKETVSGTRSSKKESSSGAVSSTGFSGSERLGKQSRMKKLGLTLNTSRRMSDDRVNSPPVTPIPCAAYTFTFHVPTPVYKRFKMRAIFPNKASSDVKLVRMHPMDARRYSLLKIGRELVRLKRLSAKDMMMKPETSLTSSSGNVGICSEEHNSLIDPQTGELLCPLPGVGTEDSQNRVQSSSHERTELRRQLEPQCEPVPKLTAEGCSQTSLHNPHVGEVMDKANSEKMQRGSPGLQSTPTSHTPTIQTEVGDCTNSQSWQALDRDRRPSVKVEYPAQRGASGSGADQWQSGQPPPQSWAGAMWNYPNSGSAQWGEQWQNCNQSQAWSAGQGGQAYNYGSWMGGGPGFQHPSASGMYPYSNWSQSAHAFTSQPSVSTAQCQSATTGSSPSTAQGGMGPMSQGQSYPQGFTHYGSGGFNQPAAFSPSGHHSNAGGKFTPHFGMGTEHFPYPGAPPPHNYSNMGHGQYPCNYRASGYGPAGAGRKGMCPPGFGVGQQQQQQPGGEVSGLPLETQQYVQCGVPSRFEPSGGYSAAGPAPTLPSASPHGPGPGPGPTQFGGHSSPMYSPNQHGSFMPPSQQQPGQFFQPSQFGHQSGQFPCPPGQANNVPPLSGQSAYSSREQGNQPCPVSSETSSQGLPCQTSGQLEQSPKSVNQQGQYSLTSGHQNQQGDKSESDSGCPENRDSSVSSHDLHTPEQQSFLQQAACQALTTKVCEPSEHSAQNLQSDRPETNSLENSTDTTERNAAVQNTKSFNANRAKHTKSKRHSFDDKVDHAVPQNMNDNCDMKDQKTSIGKCILKDKSPGSSYKDKQQQRNAVKPCSRQNVRRSSVQLWSDGDSDSGEENSNNEESSDDYQPCRSRRSGRKRKSSRHQSPTEIKRRKRSSVNYDAHAFSKYLDRGFEKKTSPRLRQSHNQKEKKRKKKGDPLIEGVHYIVVGKFKGNRVMLVKVDKVKVKVNERVKVSDWSRTGGKCPVTPPRRLQGPRCRRIAKGTPPDDPCFVHTADRVDSQVEGDECEEAAPEEKNISPTPPSDSNHIIKHESCVKKEVEDCDLKKAIKLETDQTLFPVHVNDDVSYKHSHIKTECHDGILSVSCEQMKTEAEDSPHKETGEESKEEPGHRTECGSSGAQPLQVESHETEDSTDRKKLCVVKEDPDATANTQNSEEREPQGDSKGQDHGALHTQPASSPSAETPEIQTANAGDFIGSSYLQTDGMACDTVPTEQRQSPMLLPESSQPVKGMSTTIGLSLLEGKSC
ncbi:uncharacterized protein LOC143297738 [Babylonia areolata]|uniref:uncharacterized protein LOC143297738 n=1 Tax=Babylonia areolata TaxID=304850 RepID=UPI003FCF50CA